MLCTERRLNLVEAFKDDAGMRKDLQTLHLKRVPDLMRIVRKFHQHKAGLQVRSGCSLRKHTATFIPA